MLGGIARLIVRDLLDVVAPQDAAYFRESREARFGMTLEQVQAGTRDAGGGFAPLFLPVRLVLRQQHWLVTGRAMPIMSCSGPCSGRAVSAGSNCWRRPIRSPGHKRMLDLFDGLARKAKTVVTTSCRRGRFAAPLTRGRGAARCFRHR